MAAATLQQLPLSIMMRLPAITAVTMVVCCVKVIKELINLKQIHLQTR